MALTLSTGGQGGVFTLRGGSFGGRLQASVTPTPPPSFLLDDYPGAAAAYSLRKLRMAYTGAAIRVFRTLDNTQADIGFLSNGQLDTTALLAFVSGTNGYIVTWYDQSGNGYNATNTPPNCPFIVLNGTLFTLNGKATLQYDKVGDKNLKTISFSSISQPISTYSVSQLSSSSGISATVLYDSNNGLSTNGFVLLNNGTTEIPNSFFALSAGTSQTIEASNTNTKLTSCYYNTTNSYVYVNNVIKLNSVNLGTNPLSGITIGNVRNPLFYNVYQWSGFISEIIFYPTNQLTNNIGINTNINTFYTIY